MASLGRLHPTDLRFGLPGQKWGCELRDMRYSRARVRSKAVPTLDELTDQYASRIRRAAILLEGRAAPPGVKTATAAFGDDILDVVDKVASLKWDGGRPFNNEEIADALAQVDEKLGVRRGTLKMIKEGSLKALLQYNQLVSQLMTSLQAQAKK